MDNKDIMLRWSLPADRPGIRAIWRSSFGDSPELINSFLHSVYSSGQALVCEDHGSLVSSAFIIPGFSLCRPEAEPVECSYLYALGTLPEYRNRGLGMTISNYAAQSAEGSGGFISLLPATAELYSWYEEHSPVAGAFEVCEASFPAEKKNGEYACSRLSPLHYIKKRQELLEGGSYVKIPKSVVSWYDSIISATGGGLLSYERGNVSICAAVEIYDEAAHARELIFKGCSLRDAASLLSAQYGLAVNSRSPVYMDMEGGAKKRFALALGSCGSIGDLAGSYWGLALD